MKYCRFLREGQIQYGAVEERDGSLEIVRLIDAPEEDLRYCVENGNASPISTNFEAIPLSAANLLAPVTPSKIICVGRNYREHVVELGNQIPVEPLLFFKPPSSLQRPGGAVVLPSLSERVDFEGELALVIGKRTRNLEPEDDWREILRGFTLANDISARDLQKKDVQWARAKGFDTFCPVGPVVSDELDVAAGVTIETRVNGELRQQASTDDLIFSVPILLEHISAAFTLEPGDLILTGTPSGVGPLKAGDRVEVSMAGIGILANTVEAESA
ncbi:MAG: fumarylacetoacetate hydrolase family protein [Terracidiphilus sp.]|jgi:2-keto-4-pentenoate hydratase/2-oxohepta-3-ene-1,7-dioic acid hydratase in catechol pathway